MPLDNLPPLERTIALLLTSCPHFGALGQPSWRGHCRDPQGIGPGAPPPRPRGQAQAPSCAPRDYVAVAGEGPDGRVLGVDACKAGWIGIALGDGQVAAYTAARIDELVAAVSADGPIEVVAIDIPIGLPDAGPRQA